MKADLLLVCLFAVASGCQGSRHPVAAETPPSDGRGTGTITAETLLRDGRYADAVVACQKAVGEAQAFGIHDERHIRALNSLAEAQNAKGDYSLAEANARKALALGEGHLGPRTVEVARSLNYLADALGGLDRGSESEPLYQRALDINLKALGREHPNTAESLANLGMVCCGQQKYRDAEAFLQEAMAIYEKAKDPQKAATCLNNLAYLHAEQEMYPKAQQEYRRVLEIRQGILRPDHPDLGAACSNLSSALQSAGRNDEAASLLERAVEIARKDDPEGIGLAYALHNLGFLQQALGKASKAEALYKQAIAIWEIREGPGSPAIATCLECYAVLLEDAGRRDEASRLRERVEQIRNKPASSPAEAWAAAMMTASRASREARYGDAVEGFRKALELAAPFGEKDERFIRTLVQLALTLRNKPDFPQAEATARKAVSLAEGALGPSALEVSDALNALAVILDDTDRAGSAEVLYQRALTIRMKALGPDHIDVALSLGNLAGSFHRQQKHAEAETFYQKALGIHEKARDDAGVASALHSLGQVHSDLGRDDEAEREYRKSLQIYDRLGGKDPSLAGVCFNLGDLLRKRGKIGDALQLQEKAREVLSKTLGADHPKMATVLHNIAVIYMGQGGKNEEADGLYRRSRAIWEKAYGPDHPEVLVSLDNHARLLESMGRKAEAEEMRRRVQEIHAKRR